MKNDIRMASSSTAKKIEQTRDLELVEPKSEEVKPMIIPIISSSTLSQGEERVKGVCFTSAVGSEEYPRVCTRPRFVNARI